MVLHHENCVMLMTFFRYFFLFWFDYFCLFFSFVENIDWLPLSGRNDNSCSHIGMWPSEIFLIEWCQRVCRSHRNLMTWADHERIYITKLPFDSKEIPKSLHERLTLDVPYYHNCLWVSPMSSWSNEFSSQTCKCKPRGFFGNHKRVWVLFQNPNSKAKLVFPWSTWTLLGL